MQNNFSMCEIIGLYLASLLIHVLSMMRSGEFQIMPFSTKSATIQHIRSLREGNDSKAQGSKILPLHKILPRRLCS